MKAVSRKADCGWAHDALPNSCNPKSEIRNPQSPRRAMTLIELLVVIIILTTLVAAVIPILTPANDDRRLREAARGVNTFITGAQTRAIASGRPFGVALKRLSQETGRNDPNDRDNDNGVCLELFYVEQPPPYAGFDPNSRVCVALHQLGVALRFVTRGSPGGSPLPPGWVADLFPDQMIRPGDVIVIGDTRYELSPEPYGQSPSGQRTLDNNNGFFPPTWGAMQGEGPVQIVARPVNDTGQLINPEYDDRGNRLSDGPTTPPLVRPYWTKPQPYKILRQPMPASDQPYQLPEGVAIDLRASGLGVNDYFYVPGTHDNNDLAMIMFAPEGKVSRLRYNQYPGSPPTPTANWFDEPVVDNLFLLVGKRENCPPPAIGDDPTLHSSGVGAAATEQERARIRQPVNWLSGFSRWVVVGSQSGRIVTIENAFVDPAAIITEYTSGINALSEGSEQLRNEQILAAREFTREMSQLGGR